MLTLSLQYMRIFISPDYQCWNLHNCVVALRVYKATIDPHCCFIILIVILIIDVVFDSSYVAIYIIGALKCC